MVITKMTLYKHVYPLHFCIKNINVILFLKKKHPMHNFMTETLENVSKAYYGQKSDLG